MIDNELIKIKIEHSKKNDILNWKELLNGCETISTFTGRRDKFAKKIQNGEKGIYINTDMYDMEKFTEDQINRNIGFKYIGDVTEILAEFTLKAYGKTYGIYNYRPFNIVGENKQDTGTDFTAMNSNNNIIVGQIKAGNWSEMLDYESKRLRTFHWNSVGRYRIGNASKDQMFIFTTANDIKWDVNDKRFHGRVKFISLTKAQIAGINNSTELLCLEHLADNSIFWESFMEIVK
jgi:hypothetical protein